MKWLESSGRGPMPVIFGELSAQVLSRCAALHRAGTLDPVDPEVSTGVAGSVAGGEFLRIQLRVRRGRIQEARFKAFGCSSSIASASLACEWAEGKTLQEAESIQEAELSAALELPPEKRHCSALAKAALHGALSASQGKHLRSG